jgi:hypothetical protein
MKLARKRSSDTWLHESVSRSGWSRLWRRWHRLIVANPKSHFSCTKLTVHHCYFEPIVGMLSDIFHQKRQSVPLPPHINRFDLHALEVEKIWSRVIQKPSNFLF